MTGPLCTAAIATATHVALFVASVTISVFGLDHHDPAWGHARTWQTLFWLGVGSGVLVSVGAMFGAIWADRTGRALPRARAVFAGGMTALLLLVLLYAKRTFGMDGGLFFAVIGSMLIPFAMAIALSR